MSDEHVSLTTEELAEESRKLKGLIEEAQRIDRGSPPRDLESVVAFQAGGVR